jgi:hypothetical protein
MQRRRRGPPQTRRCLSPRLRSQAGRASTMTPGGNRSSPFGQGPANQHGHPRGGGGQSRWSSDSERRVRVTVNDQPGFVIDLAGIHAPTAISPLSPVASRTCWRQTHSPHHNGFARPQASNRAECGGRSMWTAIDSMIFIRTSVRTRFRANAQDQRRPQPRAGAGAERALVGANENAWLPKTVEQHGGRGRARVSAAMHVHLRMGACLPARGTGRGSAYGPIGYSAAGSPHEPAIAE